jgi:hypothetical protein
VASATPRAEGAALARTGTVPGPASSSNEAIAAGRDPDIVHLTEGWVSEDVHEAVFTAPESQDYITRSAELVADARYADYVPLGGKATLAAPKTPASTPQTA